MPAVGAAKVVGEEADRRQGRDQPVAAAVVRRNGPRRACHAHRRKIGVRAEEHQSESEPDRQRGPESGRAAAVHLLQVAPPDGNRPADHGPARDKGREEKDERDRGRDQIHTRKGVVAEEVSRENRIGDTCENRLDGTDQRRLQQPPVQDTDQASSHLLYYTKITLRC